VLAAAAHWLRLITEGPEDTGCGPAGPGADRVRERLRSAWHELAAGMLLACAVTVSPLCVIFALSLRVPLRRSAAYAQLARSARTDPRTGLLNCVSWHQAAAAELARAARTRSPAAVLMLDLDHFKACNDRYGHLAGDEALRVVAGLVGSQLRRYDLAGRFGGEEFVILLPQTSVIRARQIAARLRCAVAGARVQAADARGRSAELRLTVSIGVGGVAEPDLDTVVMAADTACYLAKAAGRNRVRQWPVPRPRPGSADAREARGTASTR